MNYIQVYIEHKDAAVREMLIAHLADIGFESFEDNDEHLLAYIIEGDYEESKVQEIAAQYHCAFTATTIKQENWNQQWEESFEPVVVDDFCVIRAHFHKPVSGKEYEIIITPKMSFGTGHHATTRLMIQQMQQIDFAGKSVLDFGTGTGVLAILAKKLNAKEVTAIDNDEWSYENTLENIGLNETRDIVVSQGSLEVVSDNIYDIILANINRHILLRYMAEMGAMLKPNGILVLSGILTEDKKIVIQAAEEQKLKVLVENGENNWAAISFIKDI